MRDFNSHLESQSIRYQTRIKQGAFVPIKPLESSVFKTTALYVSLVLVVASVAILPFSYSVISIKLPVNLLFIALGVFALGFWREYRELACDVRKIWFALVCLLVVVVMAYISLFWAVDSRATLQAIRQYLLEPSLFLVLAFFIATKLDERGLRLLLIGLCLALSYHPIATIWDFFANGGGRFGYRATLSAYTIAETIYVFYLVFAFGLSLALSIFTKGIARFLAIVFVCINIAALIANGGRFALLAGVAMLISPFVLLAYRYKRLVLGVVLALCVGLGYGIYAMSKAWDARYNIYNMVNNVAEVWSVAPAEMGRFTHCDEYSCSPHSLTPHPSIQWEYSSLARLSMLKATLLAIAQSPFRPNGYHFQQFYQNLEAIFPKTSKNSVFFYHFHHHNHNRFASFWFELGFVGFSAAMLLPAWIIYAFYRLRLRFTSTFSSTDRSLVLINGGIVFGLIGLGVSNIFDCIPIREGNLVLFILFGVVLAVAARSRKICA